MRNIELIDKLNAEKRLLKDEWVQILSTFSEQDRAYASQVAEKIVISQYGMVVFLRGLIEISNICKNDCFYCGIRKSNSHISRYRMDKSEILLCCEKGYVQGIRTFVLQGGEDSYYTDDVLCDIVSNIRKKFPDCAITLSLGERTAESYERLKNAGCDRYLLRHETASCSHYEQLHPRGMSYDNRIKCLNTLKTLGFQTGCGMMIGSPFQTDENLADDMIFIADFKPHMVGVGPFIPAENTPFEKFKPGDSEKTLLILSLLRIMLPSLLLPSTTALGSIEKQGRQRGILAGANVLMPNISPVHNRENYTLYNGKIGTKTEVSDSIDDAIKIVNSLGRVAPCERGDFKEMSL